MGRGTYEPALSAGITSPYAHLRQYVFSRTLAGADPAVEIVSGDPVAFVRELKQQDGMDVWLCGGGELAGTLLPEIDALIVKCYPVAIGAGIPVFSTAFRPHRFGLVDSRSFAGGAAVLTYTRGLD
ncbi:dihydrofolate reductase family protein [Streptomyces roseifaciens]|uniref:dihydrofolate reductase family protein n=1 Tax=Streptomyces roseifaciens TaxID=1488406 RepID=UPI000717F080